MKLHRSKIRAYRNKWDRIASTLSPLDPDHVKNNLGKRIVINSMGGGLWCLLNYGRCAGLARAMLPVDHVYGCSAGTLAGFAFLDLPFFEEAILQFGQQANGNWLNIYPWALLKGKTPFPHQRTMRSVLIRAWVKQKPLYKGRTRLTTLLTRHWNRWMPVGYSLVLIAFAMQMGMARRLPFARKALDSSFDSGARGKYLDWVKWLGISPAALSLPRTKRPQDMIEFALASMSLWPFFPLYKKGRDCFADGSLLIHNAFPFIIENHKKIDTLITLATERMSDYGDGFLGVAGYRRKDQVTGSLLLCSDPISEDLPKQHILWGRERNSKLRLYDYTNPHIALEEFSQGYRETKTFLKNIGLKN